MAINRRFLYPGLFLVALGAVLAAAELARLDVNLVRQALRLWPVAVIAIGVAVILRRTPAALPTGVLAAVAPGLLLGATFAAGPNVTWECDDSSAPPMSFDQTGTVAGPPLIQIQTGCGSSSITTASGTGWRVRAGSSDGIEPSVMTGPTSLSIESAGHARRLVLGPRREAWEVTLPSTIELLSLTANANAMDVRLPDSRVATLRLDANASNVRLDATGSELNELDVDANFSSVAVALPLARFVQGTFDVNAGSLKVCQPAGSGMSVEFTDDGIHDVTVAGVHWASDRWQGGDVLSTNQIALTVDATLGSVEINPIGGC
jgi:hypothetical protein